MRRLAVKWPARRARRWRIGHAAPRSAWGTRRSLGTVRTPGKGDEMSLGPSPHSFHTQSRPRVSSLKKRPRTRSVHVPRIFEVRLSMIPRSWRSAGRATRSGNAARPHTTAPAWHCRRGGGRARHTSGKTERVKGCPARTGDTSCSAPPRVWAGEGRESRAELISGQPSRGPCTRGREAQAYKRPLRQESRLPDRPAPESRRGGT